MLIHERHLQQVKEEDNKARAGKRRFVPKPLTPKPEERSGKIAHRPGLTVT